MQVPISRRLTRRDTCITLGLDEINMCDICMKFLERKHNSIHNRRGIIQLRKQCTQPWRTSITKYSKTTTIMKKEKAIINLKNLGYLDINYQDWDDKKEKVSSSKIFFPNQQQ